MKHMILIGSLALTASMGCEFHARSPEDYRTAVRAVIETRSDRIQSCYEQVLKADQNAGGTVVVHFRVAEDTGAIMDPEVTPESSAPPALSQCVVQSLAGLTLAPPDARQGDATFLWDFQKKS